MNENSEPLFFVGIVAMIIGAGTGMTQFGWGLLAWGSIITTVSIVFNLK